MSDREQQMMSRIIAGHRDAMAEYLQYCRHELVGVILRKMGAGLRSKIEADDIFQEVCSYAVQNMHEMDFANQNPFGWFCEIANRKIVDAERRFSAQKRAAHQEVGIHGAADQSQVGLVNLLVASITSPSKVFSRQQREFKIIAALEQMPEEQRQALQLRYGQGMPSKLVAEEIGKTDGATRVLITRSLKKLKTILDEMDAREDD